MARSTLPLLLVVLVTVLYISGTAESGATTPSVSEAAATNFIKVSCSATTYPALCVRSLAVYASTIQLSERQLAQTALSVSLARSQTAQTFVSRLKKFKGLKKRESEAIQDCLDEMGDTVERLSKSCNELTHMGRSKKGQDFLWHMSNVETWVSAALTDENTCLDGFSGQTMDGKIKASVRAQVLTVAQITSNALALVNKFATP